MTNHGATPLPREADLDDEAITRHLRRLHAAYPAFLFNYGELSPWKGRRWHAERIDRSAGGVLVVITGDLLELHAALQKDSEQYRGR